MGAHVLVVDDDPHILRMLSDVLAKRGYGVDTAKDGEEAYERALARAPDLIVTDVMMPKLDGWSLVRKLRLEPRLSTLPVIFLTSLAGDDERVKAFRLGADDYINKPFKLSEVVSRVEKVLGAKAAPAPAKAAPSSGLAGDLAQVGLSTLLVLIEMERKTGVLRLTAEDGRAGKLAVREGKVLDARMDDAAGPTGAESVYVMLTWSAGKFDFAVREVEMEDKIGLATTHLLMEGARLMDEASAPEAEAQLNEEAIAEWDEAERAPIVTAAKLADLVRRNARASLPAYTAFSSPGIKVPAVLAADDAAAEDTIVPADPPPPKPAEVVAPERAPRRPAPLLLVLGILAAAGGVATFAIHPAAKPAAIDVRGDASAIGAALDRGADTARMRAGGFASMPMLRTGIETDAATIKDIVANDAMLQPGPGEVIEIFQSRDGATTSLLRTPAGSRAIALDAHARVVPGRPAVEVIASEPIKTQQGADAGAVAVSVTADLQPAATALAARVTSAKLLGLDRPLELVPATAAGTEQTAPVASTAAPGLSLVVTTAAAAASAPGWLAPVRYGAFAVGALLLVGYFVLRGRS